METVLPPEVNCAYEIVIDLLQEHITWFADRQQPTARMSLEVSA